MSDFYQLQAMSLQQQNINMKDYQGKVVLIVNTASKCGLTPQYEGLQKLYDEYKDQGLVILGFPCNQFRQQEPGDANQISEGCLINYGVDFQMFEKIDVNGANSHPIYQYLKSALPGMFGNKIKWNFTKFLIASDGTPIKRFAPTTKPAAIEQYIQQALAK
ncbi:glutathione peroxidase [Pseudoalteromonas sp. C2R02]|uniref:glutathione peroxidase n=1 Tax=Pseudoalteromonas sp. C2R02 TaxID=2841565 RepID=UPI001C07F885|nr:glutathione peroxidase [Pseudoalteromonas sp. C2R02]MBU2971152.1 glutathione peroxidase [Pseudoalteromonas sp. C2R02]